MVNQSTIAKALGLSTATVSRALRNRGNHDARTRALVMKEAAKLGYQLPERDRAATDTSVRMPVIGVILATPHPRHGDLPTVALRLLRGISTAARGAGSMVHIEYLPNGGTGDITDTLDSPALRPGNLAGLIHIGDVSATTLDALSRRFVGVRVALRDPGIVMDGIGQDDVAATIELVTHLGSLGHERIGFLGDGTARSFVHARAAAFLQAMLQNHRPLDTAPVVNVGGAVLDEVISVRAVIGHLKRGTRAWICMHDNGAYRLIQLLREQGVRVPEDVSIAGFDALPVPHGMPALTTIDWPFEDMGAEAVMRLLRRLQATEEPVRQIAFPGRLLTRQSTATCQGDRLSIS